MHRKVVSLELQKNQLESRQNTDMQKIKRYYNRIKKMEEEKRRVSKVL
jgi:hypothetical protein